MNDKLRHSTLLLINYISNKLIDNPSYDSRLLLEEAIRLRVAEDLLSHEESIYLRKRAESLFNLMKGAPDRGESIVKMTTGAVHDFNNTLTIIMGYSELLNDEELDEKYRFYLNEIINAARRGSLLTKQLLGFSHRKYDSPEIVKLDSLINSLEKLLNRVVGEEICLEYKVSSPLCSIKADIALLEQSIIDLVFTLCDSMPQGGKIMIECGQKDSLQGCHAFISLKKEGDSMNLEALKPIAGFIDELGGVMNIREQGTLIELSFPEALVLEEPNLIAGGETILLLEGSPETSLVIVTGLSKVGYRLLTAANKSELIEILQEKGDSIALMITDMLISGDEGPALLQSLKRDYPSMQQLFITDDIEKLVAIYRIAPEKSNIMQKPFTLKSLKNRIRLILD